MNTLHILISLFLPAIFLFSCSISLHPSFAPSYQCLDDQRFALLQLQHDLYYAPNFTFSSKAELWDLNTDCCSWKGVTCDALGHVIGLDLSYKNFSGSFHSIFNLHNLQRLNLAGNNFNTTLFQYQFGKLPNLTHLNLSDSCFYGQIPMEISYLIRLVSLDLSNQHYCYWRNDQSVDSFGDYYPTLKLEKPNFKTLIKNMRSLRGLYLDGVNISTQSSKWCETTSLALPKLRILSMSYCGLKGPFCSSLSRLHYLSKLFLGGNPISYLPPNFLEIFSRLVSLNLANCNLSGHFSSEVFLLPKMQSIDISRNYNLMGQLPDFPINNTLEVLSLHSTNFSGKLPESIGNLKFLTNLNLFHCNFSGSIPSSIANLTSLVQLDLGFNNFSGLIPPFHRSGVPNLTSLYLDGNPLTGLVPSSLFTLPSLHTLFLGGNQLGLLPEFPLNNVLRILRISYTNFSGKLPESIGNLIFLTDLCLSSSNFFGQIPSSIANLTNLVQLDLRDNNFSGLIPPFHRSGVPNLTYIDLSRNHLSGTIHSSLFTLPSLHTLILGYNQLVGEIDEFLNASSSLIEDLDIGYNSFSSMKLDMFFQLNNLRHLDLSNMSLLIGNDNKSITFPQLEMLFLESCNLTGFPAFLKSQENLEDLDLSNNKISGAIPNWVWKKNLQYLDLSKNSLSSLDQFSSNQSLTSSQGFLSASICNLSQLESFDASYNKFSGLIPSCLGNMSTLNYLDLQQNNFSGSIPHFAKATQLNTLQLGENKLEGKLPRSLANCTRLQVLNLGNNTLHDTFPSWLGKLPWLRVLILQANRFYGPITHLKNNFPVLDVLDIASNNFSGQLSIEFFQATHQLRSLKIGGNKLEGKLPSSLVNCLKLEVLDLGKNMIQDTFPIWLVKLPSLKVLVLRSNRFYGPIKFSEDENAFPMLHILDLAFNNFSGELSVGFFQSLRGMMMMTMMTDGNKAKADYIGDVYYHDSVTIVNKGFEIFYEKILTIFACLDLSNNSFHARIPEEIQNLKSLIMLNLSYNSFFGPIPSALGSLTELESLDLSQNNLSGKIPLQLTSLTFLAVLNLSYNQLEGSIPQSYQFGTFSNDSYKGNPRLCGLPLTRKCNEVGLGMLPPKEDADSWIDGLSDWKIVLIGYGCGLVMGFCIGYTVLNELGNKWSDSFTRNWNRKRRRSR